MWFLIPALRQTQFHAFYVISFKLHKKPGKDFIAIVFLSRGSWGARVLMNYPSILLFGQWIFMQYSSLSISSSFCKELWFLLGDWLFPPQIVAFVHGNKSTFSLCVFWAPGKCLSWWPGEDPLEEGMVTHSSVLAWIIPWTEEPDGIQSLGSQRVRHNWSDMHMQSEPIEAKQVHWNVAGILEYVDAFGHLITGKGEPAEEGAGSSYKKEIITCCCSVTQSCPTLCDLMDCSMPGFPVLHRQPEFAQTHVHWLNTIQPSHPLLPPSPPAFSLSPSIRIFSNESALHIMWPKYWSFSFSLSPSNEYLVQGTFKSLLQYHNSQASLLWCSAFFMF